MKVAFYNAAAFGPAPAPDSNLLIQVCRMQAVPRAGETVIVAGATWVVHEVVHQIAPGDESETRVWLSPKHTSRYTPIISPRRSADE